jgi:glycosyltransferase involved in cell wall biosynthesis
MPSDVVHVHAHYLHTPGSVARYSAMILGLPFTVSAHAKDIWTTPDWEKREKLEAAEWAVTCTQLNLEHLRSLAPAADVDLVYHGLDAARFPTSNRALGDDGNDPARPVVILTVARAVEKKGLDILLQALAQLPKDLNWRFRHIGGGMLAQRLRVEAERLGLAGRVEWLGPRDQDEVVRAMRGADLFCLPARIAADGDRDGLPNVLMEALSQEMAVLATPVSAIPELVTQGITGRLVASEDAGALARALAELIRDPAERLRLGQAGRARVLQNFQMDRGLDRLALRFQRAALSSLEVACASPSMPP